jgi:AcrR family transcriptional regulator
VGVSSMSPKSSSPEMGLRERKKVATRAAIRTHGLRLFRLQGYHETTTEQIAAAANVSPATFFRYFANKELLVLSDELQPTVLAAFAAQPLGMDAFAALSEAIEIGVSQLDRQDERRRRELIAAVPELRDAQYREIRRTVEALGAAVGQRLGRSPADFEIRVFTGALGGAVLAALGDDPSPSQLADVRRAIAYLASGFDFASVGDVK